jgi:D-arginine dehydrogenase
MQTTDVCIIGGGIAGASVAYRLAPHASVTVIEREPHAGYHTTGRSAAIYMPIYGSSLVRLLTRASGDFLRTPPADFAAAPLLSPRGLLTIGNDAQRALVATIEEDAAALGVSLTLLSPAQAKDLLPALRAQAFDWAIHDPAVMGIDVDLLLQGFLRGARERGARVAMQREALTLERRAGGWRIRGSGLDLAAQIVVNAAGAWADELAERAGLPRAGLTPYRRTAFIFDAPAGVETAHWPLVADADEQFYFKPEAGRLLGSLAEEVASAPCDAQADELDVAVAVDRIERVLDFPIQRVRRSWAGLRTFAPDRDPLSGFEPEAPGFYWHAGLGGFGIQTAAALSAFAAAMISGTGPPAALADLGLEARQLGVERLRGSPQR